MENISRLPNKQIKLWIKYVPHNEMFYGRLAINISGVICKRKQYFKEYIYKVLANPTDGSMITSFACMTRFEYTVKKLLDFIRFIISKELSI